MKLYQITEELSTIEEAILDADGVVTPELAEKLAGMEGELESKVERICSVIQNLTRSAEMAEKEADRLDRLAKGRQQAADGLKDYMHRELSRLDRRRVDTPLFTVSVAKNSRPSITWTDGLDALPECFRKVVTSLDGTAAYEEWKQSGELPPGFVVNIGSHLRIR